MTKKAPQNRMSPVRFAATLLSLCLLVGVLYFAKVVLIPIALAVLLTFILTPLVTRLERWRVWRIPAVLMVVGAAGLLLAGMVWIVASQIHSLANDLPRYRENIREKVTALRGSGRGGALENVRETIEDATATDLSTEQSGPAGTRAREPLPVRIVPEEGPEQVLNAALASIPNFGPALGAVATAGMSLVLVIFMLIKREDLRNRIVSFSSTQSLATTTKALDDAGRRISRYLLIQLVINGSFGLAVSIGLWMIEVPYGLLWGLCAGVFRYIPYIGPWVAALLPMSVSLITSPGWTQLLLVLALFAVLELGSNNFMEPWLYGQGIGLSAVGLLVSAAFWTWIWGPIGLVLATPMTVCLVVMGKYIPALGFLDRLLGDRPALEPHVAFLQRLLARDDREAAEIVHDYRKSHSTEAVYDDVLMPALRLAREDRAGGDMGADEEDFILDATGRILSDLAAETAETSDEALAVTDATAMFEGDASLQVATPARRKILGCVAHHDAEEQTLHMLQHLIRPKGHEVEILTTRTLPSELVDKIRRDRPAVVVIAVLPPGGITQAHYLCKLLRKKFPDLGLIVGCWGCRGNLDRIIVRLRQAGAHYVTTTLLGARDHVVSLSDALQPQGQAEAKSRPPDSGGRDVNAAATQTSTT